jgi:hypothetical protein
MKCQIEGCNVERTDLSQHIRIDHKMMVADYKTKFNVKYVIDEEKRKLRGQTRKITNQTTKQFKCQLCNDACKTEEALQQHYFTNKDPKHSHYIFNEVNKDDWVECGICSLRRNRIDFHLNTKHNITKEDYEKKFNKSCFSKNFILKVRENGKQNHESENYIGGKNSFYGKHHSEASKENISKTTLYNNSLKFVHHNKFKKHSLETRKKMSESRIGEKNPMFGIKPSIKTAHSIHGYRKDIGHSVRSTTEANYARYLIYNKIKYEFEPKTFVMKTEKGSRNCWLDFYLPETDEWIEIKNYLERDIENINLVREQYPNIKIKILYSDSEEWKQIENEYSKKIHLWETQTQNLKTNPELYLENITLNEVIKNVIKLPIQKEKIQRLIISDREILAQKLLQYFRKTGFPKIRYSESELINDFGNLKNANIEINNNIITCNNNAGHKIRNHFIDEQNSSFKQLFENDTDLLRVIRNRLGLDRKISEFFTFDEKSLIQGFNLVFPKAKFSKYNTSIAKWIIETFCEGDNFFDYSCGWGVRLLAAICCEKNYLGVDTNNSLVIELQNLAKWLKNFNNKTVEIFNENAATFKIANQIDLAYSFPPYSIKEKYKDMPINSDFEWQNSYFKPVVLNCYNALRKNGKFVCHISIELEERTKKELEKYFKFVNEYFVITKYSPFVKKERERINEKILIYEKI